ncbi:MAG: hypothetical protein LBP87_13190 [Planctomycetaceae bacterium]|jgi:hypothetical protein|nr:hypothetical protein [Planctomycetaceae bacterium]
MSGVQEIDKVLQSVRHAAYQYGLFSEGAMGQQILLLGDSFYGYRFTSKEFTAIWSASDQMLKIFDPNGKCLGHSLLYVRVDQVIDGQGSIRLSDSYGTRKVA